MKTASSHSILSALTRGAVIGLAAMSFTGFTGGTTGHAASLTPSASVLKQSANYYRTHKASLAKRYRFDYSAQTSMGKTGLTKVYIATSNTDVKKSVNLAMGYWNHKLGHTIFKLGTKQSHTMTVNLSTAKASAADRSDAWWLPAKRLTQIRSSEFATETTTLRNAMMNHSEVAVINQANRNIDAYAKRVAGDANATTLIATYRAKEVANAKQQLTAELNNINQNSLDRRARVFEYADTLAHEFGHSLGLKHSPNKTDLMYWQSGSSKVYNYDAVKNSTTGFNLISPTDKNRAKLAIKIHQALA
ncbi:matrixin family metalloprotease [Secundilactobacillus kimchicus]|uniref:matrixin family metalloprotease n=1 Tax=Secundilactobacillus kimchicus TaxID=528209 RepID=UPI001C03536E|nr:matrixin family metalloprotease [Secundilactobacillus kimchicus]MBT9672165.1 matrixin family metalloprotease [Secundilactobacillus kimchicus]